MRFLAPQFLMWRETSKCLELTSISHQITLSSVNSFGWLVAKNHNQIWLLKCFVLKIITYIILGFSAKSGFHIVVTFWKLQTCRPSFRLSNTVDPLSDFPTLIVSSIFVFVGLTSYLTSTMLMTSLRFIGVFISIYKRIISIQHVTKSLLWIPTCKSHAILTIDPVNRVGWERNVQIKLCCVCCSHTIISTKFWIWLNYTYLKAELKEIKVSFN